MRRLTVPVLIAAALALYAMRLGDAPIYLSPDEATIAIDAHALASTGRDVEGVLLPLYFHVQIPGDSREGWFTPAIFYLSAVFLQALPLSEWAIRLPTACIGVIDVVLMYLLARKLFANEWLAAFAAAALALTPAHFILSRYALDYLYPLPFILGWLLCLAHFVERGKPRMLFGATLCLGLGFFSYIASVVMMPVYAMLTALALFQTKSPASRYGVAAAGFGLPLLALVPWIVRHPSALGDTVQRYELFDSGQLNVLQGLRSFLSYTRIDELASRYWSFFNPSFLFLTGDQQTMFSTRLVGIFLLPVTVLLALGIRRLLTTRATPLGLVVLLGFITAPVAAVLVPEAAAINRAVEIIPFTILLATFGLDALWSAAETAGAWRAPFWLAGAAATLTGLVYGVSTIITRSRVTGSTSVLILAGVMLLVAGALARRVKLGRLVALGLLVLMPLQFAVFARDYFTSYRLRAASWLGGNLRGALEDLMERAGDEHAPAVYFSTLRATSGLLDIRNRWMDSYWKFYLIKHGRQDLLQRSARFDGRSAGVIPPGSLVLANDGDVPTDALVRAGELKPVQRIPEVDGASFFVILRR